MLRYIFLKRYSTKFYIILFIEVKYISIFYIKQVDA